MFMYITIPVLAAWLTCATSYFFSASTQLGTRSAGFPFPYTGDAFFFIGRDFNLDWFALDTVLFATLEYLVLFLYRGFRLSGTPSRTRTLVISR